MAQRDHMNGYVCKHCGSDRGFDEHGSVECSAYRPARSIKHVEGEGLKVTWGGVDVDTFDADYLDPECVRCVECGKEEARLEDLVVTRVNRDVLCRCGHKRCDHEPQPFNPKRHTRGLVSCTDCECDDFAAERDVVIHPAQIALDVAT